MSFKSLKFSNRPSCQSFSQELYFTWFHDLVYEHLTILVWDKFGRQGIELVRVPGAISSSSDLFGPDLLIQQVVLRSSGSSSLDSGSSSCCGGLLFHDVTFHLKFCEYGGNNL
jgi:hypothetical protein